APASSRLLGIDIVVRRPGASFRTLRGGPRKGPVAVPGHDGRGRGPLRRFCHGPGGPGPEVHCPQGRSATGLLPPGRVPGPLELPARPVALGRPGRVGERKTGGLGTCVLGAVVSWLPLELFSLERNQSRRCSPADDSRSFARWICPVRLLAHAFLRARQLSAGTAAGWRDLLWSWR